MSLSDFTNKKFGGFVSGLFFLLCAYLNLNDPDPEIWVTYYLVVSAIYFLSLYLDDSRITTSLFCALFCASVWLLVSIVQDSPLLTNEWTGVWAVLETEEGREVGGILCVLCSIVVNVFAAELPLSSLLLLTIPLGGLFSLLFLQPLLNSRQPVAHCTGQI